MSDDNGAQGKAPREEAAEDRAPEPEARDGDRVDDEPLGEQERREIEKNLKSKSTWLRLVFMIVFYVLGTVASMVASVVVGLGFLWVLFTGETNDRLQRAGQGLAMYIYQVVRYLTYNSADRPFPFDLEWPDSEAP